jgi:hypothetical protein
VQTLRRDTVRPPVRATGTTGTMRALAPQARRARERMTAIGVFSILAIMSVFGSVPVPIRTGAVEWAGHVAAVHRLRALVAHVRYRAVHAGGADFTVMIIAELLSVLAIIAVSVCWAERRAGNRSGRRAPHSSGHPDRTSPRCDR